MRKILSGVFLLFSIVFFPSLLFAGSTAPHPESQPSTCSEGCIPAGLDFKSRHAVRRLIEFQPFGGEYLGNYLHNSFVVGARLGFRISQAITIGAEFNYSRVQFDGADDFGRSVTSRDEYLTDVFFTYAFPVLQRAGKTIQECDLFTTVGVGNIHINGRNRFVGMLGGGLKIFFSKPAWLALRFDVNTYMYSLPTAAGSKFADDWSFSLGPSFLFVPRKPKPDTSSTASAL